MKKDRRKPEHRGLGQEDDRDFSRGVLNVLAWVSNPVSPT